MKKMFALALTLALTQICSFAEVVIGKPAPDFTVKDVEGKTLKLGDYKGKFVVLENYNLDCPYVQYHYKPRAMQDLQAESTAKGVVWLVVNSSYKEPDRAKKELASQKIKATAVVHDPKGVIGKAYDFKTTPHMIVINKEGLVAYDGAIDDKAVSEGNPREARNYVREALTQLLAGKPVAKPRTKPYGCGAKYAQ